MSWVDRQLLAAADWIKSCNWYVYVDAAGRKLDGEPGTFDELVDQARHDIRDPPTLEDDDFDKLDNGDGPIIHAETIQYEHAGQAASENEPMRHRRPPVNGEDRV